VIPEEVAMEVLYPRCAGLDVHKDTVVAAVRVIEGDGSVRREVETYATTTPGLLALSDWLDGHGCPCVVMEATGIYWRPVWQVLATEGSAEGRTLILANAAHVKNVPGRKTDVADAVWLSDLLAHGLIRPSFVPDAGTRAMRDLLRTRKQLVREQASHVQRIQKTLEDANLKLASVLTDIMGQSGRAVLAALAAGETDPDRLRALVGSRVKASPEAIRAALTGRPGPHHRFLLGLHLGQIDALAAAVDAIDAEVERDLGPFREAVALLATIPGVGELTAEVVLAEIGLDMGRFPTAGHLISWAGLCPRQDESAGKRRSTRLKKGAPWLKTALVQAAWAAVRKKHSYLNAQFQRLRARRGPRKAICAVAASILTAAYHMLKDGTFYADPGPDHFRRTEPMTRAKALARQIERLGFTCSIAPGEPVSI
jgi:transposase